MPCISDLTVSKHQHPCQREGSWMLMRAVGFIGLCSSDLSASPSAVPRTFGTNPLCYGSIVPPRTAFFGRANTVILNIFTA